MMYVYMSLQNIQLRNYLIDNFMNKTTNIYHEKEEEENIVFDREFEYNEEKKENVDEEKTYKYLDDDVLNQVFTYDPNVNYNIHLGMFQFVENTVNPFLQYFLIPNKELQFPVAMLDHSKFELTRKDDKKEIKVKEKKSEFSIMKFLSLSSSKSEEEEENPKEETEKSEEKDDSEHQTIFKEQCFEFFKKVIHYNEQDVSSLYRGFLQENNDIFVFFDCSEVTMPVFYELDLKNKKPFQKIIVNEIINNDSGYLIDSQLINLFFQNSFLKNIKELDNTIVELPVRAYLCSQEDGVYQNLYYENKSEEITLINKKVYHPEFDYLYVFTEQPLKSENIENIKSHALFVKKDIPIITEAKEDLDLIKENLDEYNVFYFMYKGNKYFGVRNEFYFQEI